MQASKMKKNKTALLIIDMLNDFNFAEAKALYAHALPAARAIAKLKVRLKKKNVPVIYVNDNFDQWLSNTKRHGTRKMFRARRIKARPDSPLAPRVQTH